MGLGMGGLGDKYPLSIEAQHTKSHILDFKI